MRNPVLRRIGSGIMMNTNAERAQVRAQRSWRRWPELGGDCRTWSDGFARGCWIPDAGILDTATEDCCAGSVSQGVQGATVLHSLARWHGSKIQGATQSATRCNTGCYIRQNG